MTISTTDSQAFISLRSFLNPQGPTQQTILNYQSEDSLTAAAGAQTIITVAPTTTGHLIDFAVLFPALTAGVFISIADITNPGLGFKFYFTSGAAAGAKQTVGENSWFAFVSDGAAAPNPVYIDNASTDTLVLAIGLMSN
jgi:hypothetical protein